MSTWFLNFELSTCFLDDCDHREDYITQVIKAGTFNNIRTKYLALLKNLKAVFKKNDICPFQIISDLCAIDEDDISVFASDKLDKKIQNMTPNEAMNALFHEVAHVFRYFDCEMLEAVVEGTECKDATDLFKNYYEQIEDIVFVDLAVISKCDITQADNCKAQGNTRIFKIKYTEKTIHVKKWNLIKKTLNNSFRCPKATFHFNNVTPGCLTFICEISLQAKNYLLQLKITENQLKPLAAMKITCLTIDDEWELKVPLDCNNKVTTCEYIITCK